IASFMSAFNDLNGVPATGNPLLLKTILRNDWKYDGVVVSDWNGVAEMITHGYAADDTDAAEKAANAGVDIEMTSTAYENNLKKLVTEGKVSMAHLDNMVRNILRMKYRLGLFNNPYTKPPVSQVLLTASNLEAAKQAAIESAVLLKNNNNVLPLNKSLQKIAVIGPMADAPHDQLGTWAFDGESKDTKTPLDAMRKHWGEKNIFYAQGLAYSRDLTKKGFAAAMMAARKSDVIIFFAGEEAILSGEAHSRANINLPGAQEDLINELYKTGKPVVLVIMAGRPITLGNILNKVNAVLMAWHPGTMGGPAITDMLCGDASPNGRLPVTWPKTSGQIPVYYNHTNTGRPSTKESYVAINDIPVGAWQSSLGNTSSYLDIGYTPQFTFGYGLTYTTFSYKDIEINKKIISKNEPVTITAKITNTGSRPGTEVVQCYVQQLVGEIVRPVKELKEFKRVVLKPGQTETVTFEITADELAFYNQRLQYITQPGKYNIWIGKNADEGLKTDFELK
ncbi:MAG: glycosyl hydrolase, partial [Mucilaginibacter sp.]|nr:glycosyl hydrolase [Mucilaginibacter sp.]